ncbi:MAG TPA: site-specific integrase [Bacillales bacterium]|nr:site-specific integrase [Bacillales bacterium]
MAGRGNVHQRGKDSWRLQYSMGFDQNGKRIWKRKTVKAKNKTEARRLLAEFQTEIEAGEYIDPSKMKFADFVDEWREKYAKKHLSNKTIQDNNTHLKNNILPVFGHMRLDEFNPIHIINFLDSLEQDGARKDGKPGGLASSTIHRHYAILRDIFKCAEQWRLIQHNPVNGVQRPKVKYKKFDVYDEDEARFLFEKLQNEPLHWRIFLTLALTCGLRRGELLALEKEHIDFEQSTIDIKQQLRYTKEKGHEFVPPKASSARTVAVPPDVMEELQAYIRTKGKERLQAAELWKGGEHFFIFSTWNGKPYYPDVPNRWWRRFTKRTGLKHIRIHDFRHTSASLLINQGAHAKVIAERLGHADITTTMNTYGHVYDKADKSAAAYFDTLRKPQNESKKA